MGILSIGAPNGWDSHLLSNNFDSNAKELDLVNDNWTEGFVNPELKEIVAKENNWLKLRLENFTIEEIKFLALKLSKMELDGLDLSYNCLTTEATSTLLQELSHSKIKQLIFNDNILCAKGENITVHMEGSKVNVLNLDSVRIGEEGGKLSLNLKDSLLQTLRLSRNKIGLNGSILSLDLTGSQLEELDISYNPLSKNVIQELLLSLSN